MQLLDGLSIDQVHKIRQSASHMSFDNGATLWREGDQAFGLYVILDGEVEISRKSSRGEVVLSLQSTGAVIGELGLLQDSGIRTATVRATRHTEVFVIPGNPVRLFEQFRDWGAVMVLVKNLIGVVGERIRTKDRKRGDGDAPGVGGLTLDPEYTRAVRKIENLLPQHPSNPFMYDKQFNAGEALFRQGDKPDGFYFVHNGTMQIVKTMDDRSVREIARQRGPTLVGEIGFFARQNRSATVKALDRLATTHFSGRQFVDLEVRDPRAAADVAFAAIKIAIIAFLKRENAQLGSL